MHMADALISLPIGAAGWAASGGALAGSTFLSSKSFNKEGGRYNTPLIAVSAAFVFTAQMINFAIPGTGSSGHITGSVLLSALLGGPPALFAIAAVLCVQAFVFADGGILALGCNIFNMGVIPCLLCYPLIYAPLTRRMPPSKGKARFRVFAASLIAAVVSAQLGAFMVVVETAASGVTTLPFGLFLALMQPVHLAIGALEGIVTGAVICFFHETRPEILPSAAAPQKKGGFILPVAVLGVLAVAIGGFFYRLASEEPDGLEWSVARAGYELVTEDAYDRFGGFSGIVGGLIVFAICAAFAAIITIIRKRRRGGQSGDSL